MGRRRTLENSMFRHNCTSTETCGELHKWSAAKALSVMAPIAVKRQTAKPPDAVYQMPSLKQIYTRQAEALERESREERQTYLTDLCLRLHRNPQDSSVYIELAGYYESIGEH